MSETISALMQSNRVVKYLWDGNESKTLELRMPTVAEVQPIVDAMRDRLKEAQVSKDQDKPQDYFKNAADFESVAVLALRATLVDDDISKVRDEDLTMFIRRTGGMLSRPALAALELCGLPSVATLDKMMEEARGDPGPF